MGCLLEIGGALLIGAGIWVAAQTGAPGLGLFMMAAGVVVFIIGVVSEIAYSATVFKYWWRQ